MGDDARVHWINDRELEFMLYDLPVVVVAFVMHGSTPCIQFFDEFEAVGCVLGKQAPFARLDTVEHPTITSKFGVKLVPTTVVFKEGKEIKRLEGPYARQELHSRLWELVRGEKP